MRSFLLVAFILFPAWAWSNQTAKNSLGQDLKWYSQNIPLVISTNSQSMSAADVQNTISNSIAQWNMNSPIDVQVTSASVNEIKFLQDFSIYGSAVIGVTELSYNDNGAVSRASIFLNEQNYTFNTNQSFQSSSRVFLGDVVTHELGHLFGLAHSEVMDSSMFFSAFPGQSSVSLDDKAAIRQKYNAASFGSISGHVQGGNHIGVLGVHVQAISTSTGEVASAISSENGTFKIGGLPLNDTYYIYTSPVKNLASLPAYYSNVQTEFCPGAYTGTFYTACGDYGNPQGVPLSSTNADWDIGVVSIGCSLASSDAYSEEKIQSTFSPVTIMNYSSDMRTQNAFVGYFRNLETNTLTFSGLDKLHIDLSGFGDLGGRQKYVTIKLISQPLGTPLEYRMDILQGSVSALGAPLEKTQPAPAFTFVTGLSATLALSSDPMENIFDLEIQARNLTSSVQAYTFPSYRTFVSTTNWAYLVVVGLQESTTSGLSPLLNTGPILSDNSSCLDAPFTYAVSNSISPSDSSSSQKQQSLAACGTIEPPSGAGPSSSLPLLVSGFLVTLLTSLVMKRGKKFLS